MRLRSTFHLLSVLCLLLGLERLCGQDADAELDQLLKAIGSGETSDAELEKLLADPKLSEAAQLALQLEAEPKTPKWNPVLTLEAGLGMKRNVALSPVRPESSPFLRSLLDLIVMRDDSDGLQAFIYGSWEDFRYNDSEVDKEQTGLLMAEVKKEYDSGWDLGWNGQYIYQNQVLDLSTDFAIPERVRIEGNTLLSSVTARRYLRGRFWAEGRFELGRQNFIAPLDDFWEYTPRFELAKWWKQNHVALSYQFSSRPYDNRNEPDGNGLNVPGTQLEFNVHRIELEWKQNWDAENTWRTTTRVRREISNDNGSGYFKYRRWRVAEKLRYRRGAWTVQGEGIWSFYHYPNQLAALGSPLNRRRIEWAFKVRVDRRIHRYWKGYLAFDWNRTDSNQAASSYTVSLIHAGLVFER